MAPIDDLLVRMDALLQPMRATGDERQHFLATYMRTTLAVKHEIERGGVRRRRLDRAVGHRVREPLPGRARGVERRTTRCPGRGGSRSRRRTPTPRVPPIRHLLLGMNAHINYDLPQALIQVITDQEFDDPALVARRSRDHEHIDAILSSRVAAEDGELRKMEQPGDRTLLDHLLTPFNRAGLEAIPEGGAGQGVAQRAGAQPRAATGPGAELGERLRELEATVGGTRGGPPPARPGPATADARRVRRAALRDA